MARLAATAEGASASIRVNRPRFKDLWDKYPVRVEAGKVYEMVGGNAYELYQGNPTDYANACALRLSRAFNYGGLAITKNAGGYKVKGADGKLYLLRVKDMISFVKGAFGAPDLTVHPNGADKRADFNGKKGVIVFNVEGWGDATGHVTLWDGSNCGDSCYFTHPGRPSVKTKEILFWYLK